MLVNENLPRPMPKVRAGLTSKVLHALSSLTQGDFGPYIPTGSHSRRYVGQKTALCLDVNPGRMELQKGHHQLAPRRQPEESAK
jgi:hypothetical protein